MLAALNGLVLIETRLPGTVGPGYKPKWLPLMLSSLALLEPNTDQVNHIVAHTSGVVHIVTPPSCRHHTQRTEQGILWIHGWTLHFILWAEHGCCHRKLGMWSLQGRPQVPMCVLKEHLWMAITSLKMACCSKFGIWAYHLKELFLSFQKIIIINEFGPS